MKKITEAVFVLATLIAIVSRCGAQLITTPPPPYTFLQPGFTQATFGITPSNTFICGVAFAPDADVWAVGFGGTVGPTIFRFDSQTTNIGGYHPIVSTTTNGATQCGITNHPNGNLYSNTTLGVVELSNPIADGTSPVLLRTIGLPGNALGIEVDPQTKHLVYVGFDCDGSTTAHSCTLYDLDPTAAEPISTAIAVLSSSSGLFPVGSIDGIAFDPSGNFLFLSTGNLTILKRNGSTFAPVQQVTPIETGCTTSCVFHVTDGIAFHATSPQFVVTDNIDGTMTRFDFPNTDFTQPPTVSLFASGGARGDHSGVGPDGCLYITLDPGTFQGPDTIGQICGGFAQPPGSSQTVTLTYQNSGGQPETQIATIPGVPNSDPTAQSLALTLASVTNAINVSVTFFYEPTDLSTGTHGVGIADGVCEAGATETQDFDCRLADHFNYPTQLLANGDRLVPHIIPSHNNEGVWVRVIATRVSDGQPAVAGVDYNGPVDWYYAWNTNPSLVPPPTTGLAATAAISGAPNPEYPPGWNNLNPQMYDRPGANTDIAFITNITTYSKFNCTPTCVGTADPGTGGRTGTLNDIVVAAPPNPPAGSTDVVEPLIPFPTISPFPYVAGRPMLVAFELEKAGTEISDPNALTSPHSVTVGTLDSKGAWVAVQYPPGFPKTFRYNPFFKVYYIFLSSAPYKTDGTVYTLQINSDLFPQPVNAKFVMKKDE